MKNIQVVVVSGDDDEQGYKETMAKTPWVALPYGADASSISSKIKCTGYPTPGVINGSTGEVITADCFGKVDE